MREVYSVEVDYFRTRFNNIRDKPLRNAVSNFFFANGGFSDQRTGRFSAVRQRTGNFIGRNRLYFYPYGTHMAKPTESYNQLICFQNLVEALKRQLWIPDYKDKARNLMNMLDAVLRRFEALTHNAYKIEELLSVVSASGYAAPLDLNEWDAMKDVPFPASPKLARQDLTVPDGYITAYAMTGGFNESDVMPLKLEDIFEVHNLWGMINEVSVRYMYAKDILTREFERTFNTELVLFTKDERLDFAFEKQWREYSAPAAVENDLKLQLLRRHGHGFGLPENRMLDKVITLREKVRNFIDAKSSMFGYVREFAITKLATKHNTKQGLRFYGFDPKHEYTDKELAMLESNTGKRIAAQYWTLKDLITMMRSSTFHENLRILVDAMVPIIINLPIKLNKKKFFENPKAPVVLPITIAEHEEFLKIGEITVYYDYSQEYTYVKFYRPELLEIPMVVPVVRPEFSIIPNVDAEETLLKSMKLVNRMTKNVKIIENIQTLFPTYYHSVD